MSKDSIEIGSEDFYKKIKELTETVDAKYGAPRKATEAAPIFDDVAYSFNYEASVENAPELKGEIKAVVEEQSGRLVSMTDVKYLEAIEEYDRKRKEVTRHISVITELIRIEESKVAAINASVEKLRGVTNYLKDIELKYQTII